MSVLVFCVAPVVAFDVSTTSLREQSKLYLLTLTGEGPETVEALSSSTRGYGIIPKAKTLLDRERGRMADKLVISLLLFLLLFVGRANGFGSLTCRQVGARCSSTQFKTTSAKSLALHRRTKLVPLSESENSDGDKVALDEDASNFDGAGFAGYLAPYVLAALGSILVTGLFVKIVLLDY